MNYKRVLVYVVAAIAVGSLSYMQYTGYGNNDKGLQEVLHAKQIEQASPQSAPSLTKADVEQIVEEVINKKPKLIINSVEHYYESQKPSVQTGRDVKALVSQFRPMLFSKHTPQVGDTAGKIKIVEFFDYSCTFCKKMLDVKRQLLKSNPDVQIFFKEMPVLGDNSSLSSLAAMAVYMIARDKYFEFHKALLSVKGGISPDVIYNIATKLEIDVSKLKASLDDPILKATLQDNLKLAQHFHIRGAPAYIIDNKLFIGTLSYDLMQSMVDEARSNGAKGPEVTPDSEKVNNIKGKDANGQASTKVSNNDGGALASIESGESYAVDNKKEELSEASEQASSQEESGGSGDVLEQRKVKK